MHAAGFFVVDDFVLPNTSVRGIPGTLLAESGVLKVMIDGHSTAFRPTGGNWLGPELIPLSAVERVEIIRGPASALYGADAFLGVINIVTRKGAALKGAELTARGGASGGRFGNDEDFSAGAQLGQTDVIASFRHFKRTLGGLSIPASSPRPTLPSYATSTTELTQESNVGLLQINGNARSLKFGVSGYVSILDRSAEFSPLIQFANGVDSNGNVSDNHVGLANGHVALRLQLPVSETLELTLDSYVFHGGPRPNHRQEVGSDLYYIRQKFGSTGLDSSLDARWTPSSTLTAVAGLGFLMDREALISNVYVLKAEAGNEAGTVVPEASALQGMKTFLNPAAYLQTVWSPLASRLSFTGGARFDYHNIYGGQVSGRLGAVANLSESLNVKLLYGKAFKAPSPLLLYAIPMRPGDVIGNANLKAQFVHTLEGEVTYKLLRQLSLSTSVAYNYLLDVAEFTSNGVNKVARNSAQEGSLAWKLALNGRYGDRVEGYSDVELTRGAKNSGLQGYQAELIGDRLGTYPRLLAHVGAAARLPSLPLRISTEVVYVGRRRANDENIVALGAPYTLEPYVLLGAKLSTVGLTPFREHETTFSLAMKNLLGTQGANPGHGGVDYPLAPRAVLLEVRQAL